MTELLKAEKTKEGVRFVLPEVQYLDVQAGKLDVEIEIDQDMAMKLLYGIAHALGSYHKEFEVVGTWGTDAAYTDMGAREQAQKILAQYPHSAARAQKRDAWVLEDGEAELYAPWEPLDG